MAPNDKQPLQRQSTMDPPQLGQAWAAQAQAMRDRAAAIDWSKVDWSKLAAQDVGVRMGPVMTEEQFKAYREQGGRNVHVIRTTDQAGKKP